MTKIKQEREEERDHGGKKVRVTVVERKKEPHEVEEEARRQREVGIEARLADLERRVAVLEKQGGRSR
jgi:hypothetical protein